MKLFGLPILEKACKTYPDAASRLGTWKIAAEQASWASLNDIRKTWRDTDTVNGKTVFNIRGNNYRLICQINYRSQTVFIHGVLTHAEYDREGWK